MCRIRREFRGVVNKVRDDPYSPEDFSLIDVTTEDGKQKILMVTQHYRDVKGLCEGNKYCWKVWKVPIFGGILTLFFEP